MKTMLITGGSRGIGAATAILAAQNGYAVAVNYHQNIGAANKVISEITAGGGKAVAIRADITNEQEVLRMFSEVERQLGVIDSLINNAGILEHQMRLEEMSLSRIQKVFMTNVFGQFICAREAVKKMSTRHGGMGGTIVNVSSLAAKTGSSNEYIDYAASKGAIDTLTIGLSKEVAAEGIRVNGVRPAFIYTDIHGDGGEAGRVERIKDTIPMKRGGYAKEVAEAILWLASEKSSYCNGTFIDLTGGK